VCSGDSGVIDGEKQAEGKIAPLQVRSQGDHWGQLPPNSESSTSNFQANQAF